jgi:hypothetical protein
VEAIGYLDSVRRTLPATLCVRAGTIAHDDLDAGVLTQPVGEHVGGAIIQQIDRAVRLVSISSVP